MRLDELVRTSRSVAETSARLQKIALLAELLKKLQPTEVPIAVGFLTGWPRQGKIGVGWATVSDALSSVQPATSATLTLAEVDHFLTEIQSVRGKNSASERKRLLAELLGRSTAEEQSFLGALAVGEVRQGALDGVLTEAVARAADLPASRVRRAAMLAGDLGTVANAVLTEGEAGLSRYALELFRPVQPMLADSAPNVEAAIEQLGTAVLEWKLDGARVQVHRRDERIAVYTRSLNDVTAAVPEVVEAARSLGAREIILDGEVIALDANGKPLPFQDTMRRFGKRLNVEALRATLPVTPFFFDVLHVDGEDLLDHPLAERLARLDAIVPSAMRVPRLTTGSLEDAQRFEAEALARGHEGVMAKAPDAPYAAGRRGSAWLKVKRARTLDLVVLGVEWGSGRRKGWLSNLHLGARDPETGGFVMLGKTFKGMTDEILEWQTKELLARETHRDGHIVYVRPELVVEVAFNEVQRSSQYPGGVTLRFARVKGYRPDKRASEADTIDAVRAFA
jgi:DNA ligase-1